MFPFLLGEYLEVDGLNPVTGVYLTFKKIAQ